METKREKVNRVCPITGLEFFMRIEDESGDFVDTFGGPFDSYTTPTNDGDDWIWERYCHDRGHWVGFETVPDHLIVEHLKSLSTSQKETIERLREMLSNLFYLLEDEEFTYEVDLAVMDAKEEFDLMKLQDSNLNTTEPIDQ